ncbi:MAG: FtsX-like permease family protein [Vicingaceae bacterium]
MITAISWRNIWRSKGRSLVVIGAIAVGIWALIFLVGFMNAWLVTYVKNQIKYESAHLQVHHPRFKKDYEVIYTIKSNNKVLADLIKKEEVRALAHRSISNGMIASPRKAGGVQIKGIVPDEEIALNRIDSFISEGSYFQNVKRNPIVIGYKLAEKLKVKLRSKVVLTLQDKDGQIVSGAFRICGILKSSFPSINELNVQVRQNDLNRLLGIGNDYHEIAVLLKSNVDATLFSEGLRIEHSELMIEDWKQLAPEMEYFLESSAGFIWVLQIIIMISLIFGIINTMLMSVLERFKELGMLMAVGMEKSRIFRMIMTETLFLAIIGSPIGLLLAWLTIAWFGSHGMDLSNYSQGLEMYGYDNVLYPVVPPGSYFQVIAGVFLTAILGAIYPAIKAIRLKPIEALHKI